MADTSTDFEDKGTLVLEQRFAIVPEWVIDADISNSGLTRRSTSHPVHQLAALL